MEARAGPRHRGVATIAPDGARGQLRRVQITCDEDNVVCRVIEANGSVLERRFDDNGTPKLSFWIDLGSDPAGA